MQSPLGILVAAFAGMAVLAGTANAASEQGKVWHVNQNSVTPGDGRTGKRRSDPYRMAWPRRPRGMRFGWRPARITPTPDTTKSFVLKGDVALYGGFLGVIRQGVP